MSETYESWPAIAAALKAAATRSAAGGGLDISTQLVLARFDRFLCRVFAAEESTSWLLKGGTSILSRVPQSRSTKDVDLTSSMFDLDEAEAALRQCVARDLGDHIRFDLTSSRTTGRGDNQPGVETRRLVFTCSDAATGRRIGDVPVDLVVGDAPVGTVESIDPTGRLTLARPLKCYPYRLYPIADQIADKVCATMATNYPGGRSSSRVKDLVDLVVIASTQQVDLDQLRLAIETKRALSGIEPFDAFILPAGWSTTYRRLSRSTPATHEISEAQDAKNLVAQLVDRALSPARPSGLPVTWVPGRGWSDPR